VHPRNLDTNGAGQAAVVQGPLVRFWTAFSAEVLGRQVAISRNIDEIESVSPRVYNVWDSVTVEVNGEQPLHKCDTLVKNGVGWLTEFIQRLNRHLVPGAKVGGPSAPQSIRVWACAAANLVLIVNK